MKSWKRLKGKDKVRETNLLFKKALYGGFNMVGGQPVFGVELVLGTGLSKGVFNSNPSHRDPQIMLGQHIQHGIAESANDVMVFGSDHGAVLLGLFDNQLAVDGFERGNIDQSGMNIG